jgi:hypothetical protein
MEAKESAMPVTVMALMEAVHAALVVALKIPDDDRDMVLRVHEPHRSFSSPRLTQPLKRTHIAIDLFEGRSLQTKRRLYQEIVTRLARLPGLDIPPDHVLIRLRELPLANIGLRGGQAACDVDLGFEVRV